MPHINPWGTRKLNTLSKGMSLLFLEYLKNFSKPPVRSMSRAFNPSLSIKIAAFTWGTFLYVLPEKVTNYLDPTTRNPILNPTGCDLDHMTGYDAFKITLLAIVFFPYKKIMNWFSNTPLKKKP